MEEFRISELLFALINIFTIGIVIFLLLRYIPSFILYFIKSSYLAALAKKIILLSGFIFWILFFIWGLHLLLQLPEFNYPAISIFLAVIFFLTVWYFGRDAFAGVVIRMSNSIEPGKTIHTSFGGGKIIRTGLNSLTIDQGNEKLFTIPYTKLLSEKLVFSSGNNRYKIFENTINIPVTKTPEQMQIQITNLISLSPYCSIKHHPGVTFTGTTDNKYSFCISAYSLNSNYFNRLIYKLETELSQVQPQD